MRTITVKGVGSVSARPDYITLSLGIETQEKECGDAIQKASERINNLEAAIQNVGFEKGDLKTTSFHVSTAYESVKDRSGNYKREFADITAPIGSSWLSIWTAKGLRKSFLPFPTARLNLNSALRSR